MSTKGVAWAEKVRQAASDEAQNKLRDATSDDAVVTGVERSRIVSAGFSKCQIVTFCCFLFQAFHSIKRRRTQ